MRTTKNDVENQLVESDSMRNPDIHDWYANIMTGSNIITARNLPGNFGKACKDLNETLDAFGNLTHSSNQWNGAVDQLVQELAIIAYKNKIDLDTIDSKPFKKIEVDAGSSKKELNKEQIQLYSNLVKRDWLMQRVKNKLDEIRKNPGMISDIRKAQKENSNQSVKEKESPSVFPFNQLRWIRKRAKDYWQYTKANPLKSLIMTGGFLLGAALFIAGVVATLGAGLIALGGIALVVGAAGAGAAIGGLGFDMRRQEKEEEMKNLSPEEALQKQQELEDNLGFNNNLTSTANLANKLFKNPIDKKELLGSPHQNQELVSNKSDTGFAKNQTHAQELNNEISNTNHSDKKDDEVATKSFKL